MQHYNIKQLQLKAALMYLRINTEYRELSTNKCARHDQLISDKSTFIGYTHNTMISTAQVYN